MKKIVYLLSLLNITLPNNKPTHKNSKGEPIEPLNIIQERPMTKTVYPDGKTEWNVTPASFGEWSNNLNVGSLHSRFQVSMGIDNVIVNRVKFIPEKVEKAYC